MASGSCSSCITSFSGHNMVTHGATALIGVAVVGLVLLAANLELPKHKQRKSQTKDQGRHVALVKRCAVRIGDSIDQIETPALCVDLSAMEANLTKLPRTLQPFPHVGIRPHVKAHKSGPLARRQLELSNAKGFCCQKLCELEVLAHEWHDLQQDQPQPLDLLLSNEIYGAERYERVAKLLQHDVQQQHHHVLKIQLVFDSMDTVLQAQQVAKSYEVRFDCLVDLNVGQNRCGVDTKEQALALAKRIASCSNLRFVGLQAYHGSAQHIRDYDEKAKVIQQVCEKTAVVRDFLQHHGLTCSIITGGGTGTYLLEAASGVFTEVQPGSYLFMDVDYSKNLNAAGRFVQEDWEQSLFVLTTVMSTNLHAEPPRVVVDAGMKAVSLDSGAPKVYSSIDTSAIPLLEYQSGGDEHGILVPEQQRQDEESLDKAPKITKVPMPRLGKKLLLIPGHCDPTVNLYDFIIGFRNGVVETIWPIHARGPGN